MNKKTETQAYVGSVVESRICFNFKRRFLKFDGEKFYRDYCLTLKGVDFLVDDGETLVLVEVKNFRGDERKNVWRATPDNARKPQEVRDSKDSLDIEVAAKVRDAVAALCGAQTFNEECGKDISREFRAFLEHSRKALRPSSPVESRVAVVLLLEGAAPKNEARGFSKIAKRIHDSLRDKLKWLNCRVYVVDLNEAKRPAISRLFDATLLPNA